MDEDVERTKLSCHPVTDGSRAFLFREIGGDVSDALCRTCRGGACGGYHPRTRISQYLDYRCACALRAARDQDGGTGTAPAPGADGPPLLAPAAAFRPRIWATSPAIQDYLKQIYLLAAQEAQPGGSKGVQTKALADRLGPVQDAPRVAPAYSGEQLVGYVYLNSDHVNSVGYSGRPIHILVGLDTEGTIVGLTLIDHHEPIVLIGIPESRVLDYMQAFIGYNPVRATAEVLTQFKKHQE